MQVYTIISYGREEIENSVVNVLFMQITRGYSLKFMRIRETYLCDGSS